MSRSSEVFSRCALPCDPWSCSRAGSEIREIENLTDAELEAEIVNLGPEFGLFCDVPDTYRLGGPQLIDAERSRLRQRRRSNIG
jgi:hypothetical protein